MDVPAVQVEVCRPGPSGAALSTSVSGSNPCTAGGQRIRIDQPAGWPVLPPPASS